MGYLSLTEERKLQQYNRVGKDFEMNLQRTLHNLIHDNYIDEFGAVWDKSSALLIYYPVVESVEVSTPPPPMNTHFPVLDGPVERKFVTQKVRMATSTIFPTPTPTPVPSPTPTPVVEVDDKTRKMMELSMKHPDQKIVFREMGEKVLISAAIKARAGDSVCLNGRCWEEE